MQKRQMDAPPAMPNPLGLDARMLATGPAAQLMWVNLPPNGGIPAHPATMVVDFVILAGSGLALEAGAEEPVTTGDLLRFEPGIAHGFRAGAEGMRLLAIKHAALA